jgi:hypothetical protein
MKPPAYLGLYDGAAEVEVGHLLAELHTGRFTATSFELDTVAESPDPITSMSGIRMVPDALLADLQPAPWPCRCWNAPGRSGCCEPSD